MQNMAYIPYQSLLQQRQGQGFSETEVTDILRQVLAQLVNFHNAGQAHGSISLETLYLDPQTGQTVLAAPAINGFQGQDLSQDIYDLGRSMVVLLTNQPLHLLQHSDGTWNWQDECLVSDQLSQVLDCALQAQPGWRFAHASQMLQAIGASESPMMSGPQPNIGHTELPQMQPGVKRSGLAIWQWGAIGAGSTLLIGLAGYGIVSLLIPKSAPPEVARSPEPEVSESPPIEPISPTFSPSPSPEAFPSPSPSPFPSPALSRNLFEGDRFPKAACGDPLPSSGSAYPVDMYGVYLDFSPRNLQRAKSEFCADALKKTREDTRQVSVQVASFSSWERANQFSAFLARSFGRAEVGAPRRFLAPP